MTRMYSGVRGALADVSPSAAYSIRARSILYNHTIDFVKIPEIPDKSLNLFF